MVAKRSANDAALVSALGANKGFVSFVGAGGKKTTMYALARAHPGRVLLSSTSHMYQYREDEVDKVVTLGPGASIPNVDRHRVVALAGETDTPKRVGGIPATQIRQAYDNFGFDVCLIKCDGARARWIKSPGPAEPLIPAFADTVIPVVSAQVLGRLLRDDIAHHPERLTELLGIGLGEPILSQHIVNLLAHPDGALKGVGAARVIPLINMVDNDALLAEARAIALAALQRAAKIERVVLACMRESRVVDVIER